MSHLAANIQSQATTPREGIRVKRPDFRNLHAAGTDVSRAARRLATRADRLDLPLATDATNLESRRALLAFWSARSEVVHFPDRPVPFAHARRASQQERMTALRMLALVASELRAFFAGLWSARLRSDETPALIEPVEPASLDPRASDWLAPPSPPPLPLVTTLVAAPGAPFARLSSAAPALCA